MAEKKVTNTETAVKADEVKYDKETIVGSNKYAACRDYLSAVLSDDKSYSTSDLDKLIKDFKERAVK
jgi:hypothetical protein